MITKRFLRCTHCRGEAREYFGLEGGVYIDKTPYECFKNPNKEHDFQFSNEQIPENERASLEDMVKFFGGVEAKVKVERREQDFIGKIKGICGDFIIIEDQNNNTWNCIPHQLTFLKNLYQA